MVLKKIGGNALYFLTTDLVLNFASQNARHIIQPEQI